MLIVIFILIDENSTYQNLHKIDAKLTTSYYKYR